MSTMSRGVRRVRTPEGSRFYGLPIGAIITPDVIPDISLPEVSVDALAPTERPFTVTEQLTGLDLHLVDVWKDRDLANTSELAPIKAVVEGATWVSLTNLPFWQELNEHMGADLPDFDTDPMAYEMARHTWFAANAESQQVRLDEIVYTQPNFNKQSVVDKIARAETGGRFEYRPAELVRSNGTLYLIDGHHSVVARALRNEETFDAFVLDLDSPVTGKSRIGRGWQQLVLDRRNDPVRGRALPDDAQQTARDRLRTSVENADVWVRLPSEVLSYVIDDERILTQHESSASEGYFDPELRVAAEHALFGIALDAPASTRPVFGYLSDDRAGLLNIDPHRQTDEQYEALKQYGSVAVKLRDSVRRRTTFTIGDSLDDTGITANDEATALERIRAAIDDGSIDSVEQGLAGADVAALMLSVRSPAPLKDPTDQDLDATFGSGGSGFSWVAYDGPLGSRDIRYMEAQIHDGVSIEDIERAHVTLFEIGDGYIDVDDLRALQSRGVEIVIEGNPHDLDLDELRSEFTIAADADRSELPDPTSFRPLPVLDTLTSYQHDALMDYQADSDDLNDVLRAGTALSYEQRLTELRLRNLITAQPELEQDIVVYRGIDDDDDVNFVDGSIVTDHGFVSTTASEQTAASVGEVVEIRIPAGTRVLDVDTQLGVGGFPGWGEDEIMLPPGATFTVTFDNVINRWVLVYTGREPGGHET